MSQEVLAFNSETFLNIRSSENYSLRPVLRSKARHELIDLAKLTGDEDLWREIGELLVKARAGDDLTPQVSDRFVKECPDAVFKEFGDSPVRDRFRKWNSRAFWLGL